MAGFDPMPGHRMRIDAGETGPHSGRAGATIAGVNTLGPSPILRYFDYAHLPAELQQVSLSFYVLAHELENGLPAGAEKSTALRKLLESKDAAVRAALPE